ncbi:Aristolochene synthase in complex with 12,13 Difluorofarnesyl diphosphate [Colletotrichum caudatum]|nr:Aristolochene synthase in complex with 12,13 Difluorofarnesyl diphosphate [Colletotrichum caudatum]
MSPSILDNYNDSSSFNEEKAVIEKQSLSTSPAVSLPVAPQIAPPPSHFIAECHPLEKQITAEVDGFFLTHWPFSTAKDRKRFVAAGFSRVTCLYFPLSRDDRIHLACRLLTILFLIDDILEDMSLEDGCAYNEKLMPIARGDVLPDRNVPVEWIMYDLWDAMRSHDKQLADDVLEPTFTFMRAQTDKARLSVRGMGPYLIYREKDVGKALLCSLMRFSMGLRLTSQELASVQPIEQNVAKHLSVLNDILSWDKELLAAQTGHPEGSALCSAVQVLADETSLTYAAAKRVLWVMCREWEYEHEYLVERRSHDLKSPPSEGLIQYIKGLEYQMSGNELWSKTTLRYNAPSTA